MIDDIRYLIVFAKIAEAGSISGGAEALGLTTATASTHLSGNVRQNKCFFSKSVFDFLLIAIAIAMAK